MIVPSGLKPDNYWPADVTKPIDEMIMLNSSVQNNKPAAAIHTGRLDHYVIALS
jgi:hypothetical protein